MKRTATTLAITSGKGGVGKSVVAVNLAETLRAEGHTVALVDADVGQGACAVLLNETPAAGVIDLVRHAASKAQVLHRTTSGLTLVQAAAEPGSVDGYERPLYDTLDGLLNELRRTHRFVLIDTPAGTGGPVRWALDRADLGVLVLVDEPTAVADAYRLAKLVWQTDPDYPLCSVVNFADTEADALSVAARFGRVTAHFTGQETMYLGWVPFSAEIRHSVAIQRPAVRQIGAISAAFRGLVQTLIEGRQPVLLPLNPELY